MSWDAAITFSKCVCSNLTRNELTGSIPQALLEKSRNGTLSLRFLIYETFISIQYHNNLLGKCCMVLTHDQTCSLSGNPNLCQSGSCGTKRTLIIAVSTSVSVFVLLVLGLTVLRIKKKGNTQWSSFWFIACYTNEEMADIWHHHQAFLHSPGIIMRHSNQRLKSFHTRKS